MNAFAMPILAAAIALSGCVKVPETINVNLNDGGNSNTSPRSSTPAADSGGSSRSLNLPGGSGGGSWRDIATDVAGRVFLDSEQGAVFYAFDTLAYPDEPAELVANLQDTHDMKGVAGATVEFALGDEVLGRAVTDDSGLAKLAWTPPKEGTYEMTTKIVAVGEGQPETLLQITPAPLLAAAYKKETELVVIDLDHTVVDSSFFRVLVGGAKPMAGSIEATKRIAKKYGIVYLTHRPDLMTRKSKGWLSANGYPPGPLLVSELKQALGDSGKFKTAKLRELREAYPNVKIGIGDKLSDAQSYVDNNMTAYLLPHYDPEDAKEMRKMAKEIRKLKGKGRLHVVDGWGEVEAGIFKGRKYPPEQFAAYLDREADRVEAEKRRRDRDDDDDEEDD